MRTWPISRRTMLRGLGVAIALPMLDIMADAGETAVAPAAAGPRFKPPRTPVRMVMMNLPCGTYHAEWGADKPGAIGELKPIVKALQPFSGDLLFINNLMNKAATVDGLAHYTNEANLWTSTVVKKTTGADLDVGGISVDQIAGMCTSAVTRIPSIHLGMMAPYGGVDSGWARVYDSQLSWSAPTTPVPNEIDPKRAFDRLFRSPGEAKGGAAVVMPLTEQDQRSVLDYVLDDATSVRRRASVADQRKLDEYLTSVRDVEKQLDREIKEAAKNRKIDPAAARAVGQLGGMVTAFDGKDHTKRLRLMLDLIVLGFWTDTTRVSTFMFGHERNDLNYSFLDGVKAGHHESSHWTDGPDKLEQYKKINLWHADQVAYLLGRMKSIKEANGSTLLDNSMVFWGAALNDGSNHGRENLPVMLAGRGGGVIKPGRTIQLPEKTPLANLYLSMLQCMGVMTTSFADSQKAIAELVG